MKKVKRLERKTISQKLKLWRSFESKEDSLIEDKEKKFNSNQEFSKGVQELIERGASAKLDRKKFLTLMGASVAMAAVQCKKAPVEKIIPYVKRPKEHTPGIPTYYATSYISSEGIQPVLAKTREGKPILLEGHKDHPLTKGAVNPDAVATLWDLYDPDRIKTPLISKNDKFKKTTWQKIIPQVLDILEGSTRILARPSFSPSEKKVILEFTKKNKNVKLITYDPLGDQQEILEGNLASYGKSYIPQYHFDKADFIFSIEADFLGNWLSSSIYTKQFSSRRIPQKGKMNKLVVAESIMSLTGANADKRLSISAGSHTTLAMGLANLLLPKSSLRKDKTIQKFLADYTPEVVSSVTGLKKEDIQKLAEELLKYKAKSMVVGGGIHSREGKVGSLQIAINLLNSILENEGRIITSNAPFKEKNDISSISEIQNLVEEMQSGQIDTLIIDRANPVFELPRNLKFKEALKKVKNVITIAYHIDETSQFSKYILPVSHYLESWSDGIQNGIYVIAQPTIRNLFDTHSAGDIWLDLSKSSGSFYEYIKSNGARDYLKGIFKSTWNKALSLGYYKLDNRISSKAPRFKSQALKVIQAPKKASKSLKLSLYKTIQIGDGKGANISFRQELPDPISKITWDNYLAISPKDAVEKNLNQGDIVKITSNNINLEAPIFIQPGLKKGSMAIAVGYGHEKIGKVGDNIGINAFQLANLNSEGYTSSALNATIEKTGNDSVLASTQKHHEMQGRNLVRTTTLKEYTKDKKSGNHEHILPGKGLYPKHKYTSYRWEMAIDLNKCTGCSACVVSCYAENNIPAVGKEEVNLGREMSWLRIDRYYEGDEENPNVLFQPVMCQQCENAPCENVCPVAATTHSDEGLNDMTYNRCIGTRYCSNNCPYKVRRFNWFENWEGKLKDPQQYSLNPDVTVRSRGVIEKCSFCVQRITEKRQLAKLENRSIKDKEIKTACQSVCPTEAITFGNTNDSNSEISKIKEQERAYKILLYTNVKPSVSYLVKVKNQT